MSIGADRLLLPRRALLAGGAAALACPAAAAGAELAALEARLDGGRLGVFAVNVANGRTLAHRADDRFPMCSTFKSLLAGAVLARADAGRERLDRMIAFTKADLLSHAPVTGPNVDKGVLSVETLCKAVVEVSDNPAANLLLNTLGGPAGFTRWLRSIGDRTTRLDRYEVELNTALPGDPRDTTTPRAMVETHRKLLLGRTLKPASREKLAGWMIGATTGLRRLRKDLPPGWRAGDKTGNGQNGSSNDVAIFWPPRGGPILACAYIHMTEEPMSVREEIHAEVGRLARTLV